MYSRGPPTAPPPPSLCSVGAGVWGEQDFHQEPGERDKEKEELQTFGLTLSVTRHDLHLVHLHQVRHLPELHVVQHKRPDVITEPVGVQRTLRTQTGSALTPAFAAKPPSRTHPKVDPVPDSVGERRVDGFVELEQDLERQLGGDLLGLWRKHARAETTTLSICKGPNQQF